MNTKRKTRTALALALLITPFLVGCGSGSGGGAAGIGIGGVVPGSSSAIGCVPVSSPFGFTANGLVPDNAGGFIAGTIPGNTSGGQTIITAPNTMMGGQMYQSSGISGTIQMSLGGYGAGYGTYPYGQQPYGQQYPYNAGMTSQASGAIQLSAIMQQQIMQAAQYLTPMTTYPGYTGYPGQVGVGYPGGYGGYGGACISGMAIHGGLYPTVGGMHADVYLYLNNTAHGYVVSWY